MADEWDFIEHIDKEHRGSSHGSDLGGAGLSRSDSARARWNKMSNAERQKVRKALQARKNWKGGKYAQKSQTRGGYP